MSTRLDFGSLDGETDGSLSIGTMCVLPGIFAFSRLCVPPPRPVPRRDDRRPTVIDRHRSTAGERAGMMMMRRAVGRSTCARAARAGGTRARVEEWRRRRRRRRRRCRRRERERERERTSPRIVINDIIGTIIGVAIDRSRRLRLRRRRARGDARIEGTRRRRRRSRSSITSTTPWWSGREARVCARRSVWANTDLRRRA